MGAILRRPQFLIDLEDAWQFIAERNLDAADRFVTALEPRYRMLADNPLAGAALFRRHRGYRIFPYRNYVIIYRPLEGQQGIELAGPIHAARDFHQTFCEEGT